MSSLKLYLLFPCFKGLLRFLAPRLWKVGKQLLKSGSKKGAKEILKSAAKETIKEVGKNALKTGAKMAAETVDSVARDVKSGESVKKAFHKAALDIKNKIDDKVSSIGLDQQPKGNGFLQEQNVDLQHLINKVPPAAASAVIAAAKGKDSDVTLTPPPKKRKRNKEPRTKESIWDRMK